MKYPTQRRLFSTEGRGQLASDEFARAQSDLGFNVERLLIDDPREEAKEGSKSWAVYWSASFLDLARAA